MDTIKANKKLVKPIKEIFSEQLRSGRSIRMIVKGGSMRPLMDTGDYFIIEPATFSHVKIGDIIAYKKPFQDNFTSHRIMQKDKDGRGDCLFAKGDASIYGDALPTYPEDVYGKVVTIEKRDGKIINLESKFRRLQGYFFAKRSWISVTLRKVCEFPHLIPIKIIRKIKKRPTSNKK